MELELEEGRVDMPGALPVSRPPGGKGKSKGKGKGREVPPDAGSGSGILSHGPGLDSEGLVGYVSFRFDTEETTGPKDAEVIYWQVPFPAPIHYI